MKITAITRYKHGELYAILQRLGWTQTELCKQTGLSQKIIGDIINLIKRPTEDQANAIQLSLGKAGEYLDVLAEWPEAFVGIKRGYRLEQTEDIQMERLLDCQEAMQIAAPEHISTEEHERMTGMINDVLGTLPDQYAVVIRERFCNGNTLKQTGVKIKKTMSRVRQIEAKALRMIRHRFLMLTRENI